MRRHQCERCTSVRLLPITHSVPTGGGRPFVLQLPGADSWQVLARMWASQANSGCTVGSRLGSARPPGGVRRRTAETVWASCRGTVAPVAVAVGFRV